MKTCISEWIGNSRKWGIISGDDKIKIILSNGKEFYVTEEHGEMVINKREGGLNIAPRVSNEVGIS